MKIRKLVAAVLSALIFATSIVTPTTLPGFNIVSEAASKLKAPSIMSTSTTADSATLTWAPVSGAKGFVVYYYKSSAKKYKLVKSVTSSSCTISGLSSNTTYKFKVAAYTIKNNKKVVHKFSDVVKVTTKGLPAPSNFKATVKETSITLSWDKVKGADAYKIYVYSGGKYKAYKTVTSTKHVINNLKESTRYKFKVAALVKKGSSYKVQKKSAAITALTEAKSIINTPDFTFYDADGKTYKLSSYKGKPIIINIWATWCGPCVSELPSFSKLYKEYRNDVQFIMLNCETRSDVEYVKFFMDFYDLDFPVYYDFDGEASEKYGEGYIPLTIVIDEEGNLVDTHTGSMTESQIRTLLRKIL